MVSSMTDQPPPVRPTAEPVTAIVAERVRKLRSQAELNQAELADEMAKRGVPWKRATVVNLEKRASGSRGAGGGRDSISVQELLTLAVVLDVPPVMLLADPRHVDEVPVTDNLTVSAWEALLWMTGSGRIGKSELNNFSKASWLIHSGLELERALAVLRMRESVFDPGDPDQIARAQERDDARHRQALGTIRTCVLRIRNAGAPLPPTLPAESLRKRAAELDVDLPDLGD